MSTPRELEELAFHAARAMGMTVSGMDALPTPDGYVILEVNPVPGLLNMLGEAARTGTLNGLCDWVERQAAAQQARCGR